MAATEIPPARSEGANEAELHEVPVLVVQLQDDLARSRLREAFWMSVVFHLLVVIALATSPKWMPVSKPIVVRTAEELIRGRELTYLDLPHDQQKVDKPPDTDRISDKNRIATKRPTIDRKTLDELRDSGRPGAPGRPSIPSPPQSMVPPQPAQAAQAQSGSQAPTPGMRPAPPADTQTQAKLEPPPAMGKTGFGSAMSPGEQLQQAAKAAAAGRVAGGSIGGGGGDYGLGGGSPGRIHSDMDILSDTMGVDFGPYLSRVLHDVRLNWYNLIPEVARAPIMKKGKVSIEFAILRDGKIAGMRLTGPSGDVSLDRAAWGGITGSNPFPPLPGEFRGSYLALRFHFYYNPDRNELQ